MKIEISRPLFLSIEVLEVDENIPSFRIEMKISVNQFQNYFQYTGEFWIKCDEWDSFEKNLEFNSESINSFQDIDEDMRLTIHLDELTWSVKKVSKFTNQDISLIFRATINDDEFSSIFREFSDFPKWW